VITHLRHHTNVPARLFFSGERRRESVQGCRAGRWPHFRRRYELGTYGYSDRLSFANVVFSCCSLTVAVAGGAAQIGKGIGKGIVTGDGKAVVQGFAQGANSVGGGIAQGAESAVMGTADGFLSAGRGLFSGVKSVGRGFGGAITGKRPGDKKEEKKGRR
jgi:hypothetical protein